MNENNFLKEFYVNIPDKPVWDENKNFENQTREVQEFFINETRKIKYGLTLGGEKIHPWLYWHINYWNMMIDLPPEIEGGLPVRVNGTPELRDNEWQLSHILNRGEAENKGIILFGTRRFGKSAFISSYSAWNATTKYGGEASVNSVVGGSQKDLDNITAYIDHGLKEIHPMFRFDRVGTDWESGVKMGMRTKNNLRDIYSVMTVTNVNSGKKSSTQKTAGATPMSFVIDEIGKFPVKKTFNAAKYSFSTPYGWRCIPILLGCVCKGTKVYNSKGEPTNIEDITKESGIVGYDGSSKISQSISYLKEPAKKECVTIITESGELSCSIDHPILKLNHNNQVTFERADNISENDYIFKVGLDNTKYSFIEGIKGKGAYFNQKVLKNLLKIKVKSVSSIGLKDVYNLTAEGTHTYLANDFITHNTGGEVELSQDAQDIVNNPEVHNLLQMDWNSFNEHVPNPSWESLNWGIFVPGQMSIEVGMMKTKVSLSEYLKVDDPYLDKIEIAVTDWDDNTKKLEERLAMLKEKDMSSYNDMRMFLPLDPRDCFLSTSSNPFPMSEALHHKNKLIQKGDIGKCVDLIREGETGKIKYELSSKEPVTKYPFVGGIHDAPVIIFEEPPQDNSMDTTYVAGLDHYKHNVSSTDSLGTLYVFKRNVTLGDEFNYRIVASYSSRPSTMDIFNRNCELLLELYGAQCLQENMDISFQQYLHRKNKAEIWLANGEELARRVFNNSVSQNNKYGLPPTPKNKEYLLNLAISYCWEEIELGEDEDGNKLSMLGIERINDIYLLDEIINYRPGGNFDRITAWSHALAWERYLDSMHIVPKSKKSNGTDPYQYTKANTFNISRKGSFVNTPRRRGFL